MIGPRARCSWRWLLALAWLALLPSLASALTTQSLDAGWQFRIALGDTHAKDHPRTVQWLPATVPGSVQTDLMALKLIPDPYWRDDEAKVQWVGLSNWQYRKTFDVDDATLDRAHVDLVFEGLDTFADVYLNGHEILSADNMFRRWRVPVKPLLHRGTNTLEVKLYSPIERLQPWLLKQPYALPGEFDSAFGDEPKGKQTANYVRKAAYQYGWDWGPRVVTEGIWQHVKLESWDALRLADFHVAQKSVTADVAKLAAQLEIEADQATPAHIVVRWRAPDGKTRSLQHDVGLKAGDNHVAIPLEIAHPQRWWPVGYGKPNLYDFHVDVAVGGKMLANDDKETGLRSIELRRRKDQWGKSFEFVVNGVPIFAKGANFIPPDIFPTRVTSTQIRHLLESARDANMNMLRVWGGGYYLPDDFYATADKLGLMVWQDFMFGGAIPPSDAAFDDNVRAEATQQVRRLRDHPSIVLWCGNNEVETGWESWDDRKAFKKTLTAAQRQHIEQGMRELFDHTLRGVVAKYEPEIPYWPSTPGTDYDGPVNVTDDGDYHYWNVWSGDALPVTAYLDVTPRFMSEYGLQSMPSMPTIDAFTEPGDRSIDSKVMRAHQKFDSGNGNQRLLKYVERKFGKPRDLASFAYLSQAMQAGGIQLAAEHLRASRPRSMGSLYWQLDDAWPGITWSSIDWYGHWKALQFHARRFYAPLLIAVLRNHETTTVSLVSDRTTPVAAQWRLQVMDFSGKVIGQQQAGVTLPPLSATRVGTFSDAQLLRGADPRAAFAVFELRVDGHVVSRNLVFFDQPKNLALPLPHVDAQLGQKGDGYALILRSKVLARDVWVSFGDTDVSVSDNAFDILPGQEVTLTVRSKATLDTLRQALKIEDMADAMQGRAQ
ncbi:MAG TPA: glycoside hydrolase family 2 protein [Rhodanobacteraceae bacterium]|nr:glycoside hydrolase family 2 protein [Rhodanobacteraceae bacterium]